MRGSQDASAYGEMANPKYYHLPMPMSIKSLAKKLDRTLLLLVALVLLALIAALVIGGWETASSGFF